MIIWLLFHNTFVKIANSAFRPQAGISGCEILTTRGEALVGKLPAMMTSASGYCLGSGRAQGAAPDRLRDANPPDAAALQRLLQRRRSRLCA